MKNTRLTLGFLCSLIVLGLLAGCAMTSQDTMKYTQGAGKKDALTDDEYTYYPAYELYYNAYMQRYVYLRGRTWHSKPVPPQGITAEVLAATPSVKLDFHDSPAFHHDTVIQKYPKTWTAPAPKP